MEEEMAKGGKGGGGRSWIRFGAGSGLGRVGDGHVEVDLRSKRASSAEDPSSSDTTRRSIIQSDLPYLQVTNFSRPQQPPLPNPYPSQTLPEQTRIRISTFDL